MTDRTNRHNSSNRGEHGVYREFGGVWMMKEWGNFGWLGKLGQVVYGGNMEGVGKCVGEWGEVREGVGRCVGGVGSVGKHGEVWGMRSRCVEVCLGCGEI